MDPPAEMHSFHDEKPETRLRIPLDMPAAARNPDQNGGGCTFQFQASLQLWSQTRRQLRLNFPDDALKRISAEGRAPGLFDIQSEKYRLTGTNTVRQVAYPQAEYAK
jgi:hypothetical protein